jgi:ABC-type dipeptide/oligopeptide/nickel transport system permease component
MTAPDQPTQILARIYHSAWVAAIVLLAGGAIAISLGRIVGINANTGSYVSQLLVQIYLVLVPMAIFVFAAVMTLRKDWKLASTGYVLTLIWIGAMLLG